MLGIWLAGRGCLNKRFILAVAITSIASLLYTGPWDHAIIARGVWSYPAERVLGLTVGLVPVEEYAFYVLQVMMTGLLCLMFLDRRNSPNPKSQEGRKLPNG
jgi:lycopene cyclase domain-containing protein